MLRKDKRSLVLSLLLGDGSLGVYKNSSGNYHARFTIDHGLEQADYQAWKAQLLSQAFEKEVNVRTGHKGKSIQLAVYENRMKAWHKFTYPNNKKDIAKILPFIRHPEMAVAIWLMDDGYVEPSFSKLTDGSKKNYGARFRIFTCDQTPETQEYIIKWFAEKFNLKCKVHFSFKLSANKHYPFLKFNQEDSLKLWTIIREWVLKFKSMQYKFRHIETLYQSRNTQRIPDGTPSEDIVRS